MALEIIQRPALVSNSRNLGRMKNPVPTHQTVGAATTHFPKELVVLSAGVLVPVVSAGTAVYGWALEGQKITLPTVKPPLGFNWPNQFPLDCRDADIEINCGIVANVPPSEATNCRLQDLVVGSRYQVMRATSGTYNTYQFLDATSANTTAAFILEYVGPSFFRGSPANTALNYGRARVRIIDTALQG